MNVRTAALLAVALTATGVGTAQAATKAKPAPKACNIVQDPTGDTFAFRSQEQAGVFAPAEAAFDITSADIASDGKVVTAVVRVKALSTSIQTSPQGAGYSFDFLLPTSDMSGSLRAVLINGQAPYFEATYKDPSIPNSPSTFLGTATGSVDMKKNEVHITAPVGLFSVLGAMKKNTLIQPADDAASAGRAVPPSPGVAGQPVATRFVFADVAAPLKSIRVGAPSCVTPGK
jgi:hypothetical protein